jgi:hypothetical protein
MKHRTSAALSLIFGIGAFAATPALEAQAASPQTPVSVALQLQSLAHDRARLWAATAPTIRCASAPLTERPTASAEFARPAVLPLETAFLDAAAVKRTLAVRERR